MFADPNPLRIEVGRIWLWAQDVARLEAGATVVLDAPVDGDMAVHLNGRLVARGEPVVVEGRMGVRVREVAATAR